MESSEAATLNSSGIARNETMNIVHTTIDFALRSISYYDRFRTTIHFNRSAPVLVQAVKFIALHETMNTVSYYDRSTNTKRKLLMTATVCI